MVMERRDSLDDLTAPSAGGAGRGVGVGATGGAALIGPRHHEPQRAADGPRCARATPVRWLRKQAARTSGAEQEFGLDASITRVGWPLVLRPVFHLVRVVRTRLVGEVGRDILGFLIGQAPLSERKLFRACGWAYCA